MVPFDLKICEKNETIYLSLISQRTIVSQEEEKS